MDPVTVIVIIAVSAGVGALAGIGGQSLFDRSDEKTLLALSEQQAIFAEAFPAQVEAAIAPLQQQAESRAHVAEQLAMVPPQCLPELGGDPLSVECQWAWCVRTGGGDGQRCEQSQLVKLMVASIEARDACTEAVP